MKRNIDHRVGLYIDDDDCASCTFIDICSKSYVECHRHRGWQDAVFLWHELNSNVNELESQL